MNKKILQVKMASIVGVISFSMVFLHSLTNFGQQFTRECLKDQLTGLPLKGILVSSLNSPLEADDTTNYYVKKFFTSPDMLDYTGYELGIYDEVYIFEVAENHYLVGESISINPDDASQNLLGWLPKREIAIISNNLYVEPNWDKHAVDERKANAYRPVLFKSELDVERFLGDRDSNRSRNIVWDEDLYDERFSGEWRRFKVLAEQPFLNDDVIQVGVFSEYDSDNKDVTIKEAAINWDYKTKLEKRKKINFVFVIDGSKGMQPYFQSIRSAILNFMDDYYTIQYPYNIRFGVIFFDDLIFEKNVQSILPLTSNFRETANFIDRFDYYDHNDLRPSQPIYYGLNYAYRSMGLDKEETNVLVLVGSAGNEIPVDVSNVNENQVIEQLYKNNVHFFALQIWNDSSFQTYQDYQDQVSSMLINHNSRINKYLESPLVDPVICIGEPKLDSVNQFIVLRNSPLSGRMIFPKRGGSFAQNEVYDFILGILNEMVLTTNNLVNKANSYLKENIGMEGQIDIPLERIPCIKVEQLDLHHFLYTSNPEVVRIIPRGVKPVFNIAYAPITVQALEHPLFKYVTLVSLNMLGEMLSIMDDVSLARTKDQQRAELTNLWKELFKFQTGIEIEENRAFSLLQKILADLPAKSRFLNSDLRCIQDLRCMNDKEFLENVSRVVSLKRKIWVMSSFNDNSNYFREDDDLYFWVPLDDLP